MRRRFSGDNTLSNFARFWSLITKEAAGGRKALEEKITRGPDGGMVLKMLQLTRKGIYMLVPISVKKILVVVAS